MLEVGTSYMGRKVERFMGKRKAAIAGGLCVE
jgi:hypothetical protein